MTRIIATLHATLSDGSEVTQGQKVKLSTEDEKALDEQRALVPAGFDSFAAFDAYKQDAYRGGRGDMTAAGRLAEARSGGIVDLSSVPEGDLGYVEWLRNESPSVDDTVAAAEDDPSKAQAILEAENVVSGGEPRKGVVEGLSKITEG